MASVISGDANVSAAEFGYLDGVTSGLQSQIDAKLNLAGGKVLQVVSAAKLDIFTTTSNSFTDVTGLTVTVTPTLNTSKILIFYNVQAQGLNTVNMGALNLVRATTSILLADAAGSRVRASNIIPAALSEGVSNVSNAFIDSPNTTSATTYKIQVRTGGAGTIHVNKTQSDTDSADFVRGTSTLVAMEVSA